MGKADQAGRRVLSDSPSHLLHRVLQLALDIYAEETGRGGLTQRQFAVLAAAGALEGASQTDLVRMTGIDRSTLADMVARMIEKGWLARERSLSDARANTVRLTETGRQALEETEPKVAQADARILAALSPARRQAFLNALSVLGGDVDEEAPKEKKSKKADKPAKAAKAGKHGKGARDEKGQKRKKKKAKKLQAA